MRMTLMLMGLIVLMVGCYHFSSDGEDDLRAVPVTNNPNLVPERGLGPLQSMPY